MKKLHLAAAASPIAKSGDKKEAKPDDEDDEDEQDDQDDEDEILGRADGHQLEAAQQPEDERQHAKAQEQRRQPAHAFGRAVFRSLRRHLADTNFKGISKGWGRPGRAWGAPSCLPRQAASFIRLDASHASGPGRDLSWAHDLRKTGADVPKARARVTRRLRRE